jgi:sensor histidine kinase YesM
MSVNKNAVKYSVIFGVLVLLAVVLYTLQLSMENYLAITWVLLIVILFVYGNRLIWKTMDRILAWAKFMSVRFFIQLIVSTAYILAIINASYFLLKELLTSDPPTPDQVEAMNIIGVIIAIPVLSIHFGLYFLRAWKQSEVESEKLQKENMRTQLEALKNHLDPHFLFNNLNVLSALIDKDKETSKKFLDKFAEVYRFLLQNKGDELVDLSNEMEFLDSYLFLVECRFQNNIDMRKDISCDVSECFLPPLTLQMLLENAIKHNIVSNDKPLRFEIFSDDDDYLVVRNNLQEKVKKPFSHRTGLDNIQKRYSHFTNRPVIVEKSKEHFTVKIPLIVIEEV